MQFKKCKQWKYDTKYFTWILKRIFKKRGYDENEFKTSIQCVRWKITMKLKSENFCCFLSPNIIMAYGILNENWLNTDTLLQKNKNVNKISQNIQFCPTKVMKILVQCNILISSIIKQQLLVIYVLWAYTDSYVNEPLMRRICSGKN